MAEVKIIVIMCYYVIVGTLAYSTYGYFLATDTGLRTFREFQEYATCQSIGIQADRPRDCGDAPDFRPLGTDVLVSASFILQLLLPLVILIFITNCRSCSKKRLKIFKVQRAASVS